jgi:hypothetical protein
MSAADRPAGGTPAPTEREARTVTLSEQSVWTYDPADARFPWIGRWGDSNYGRAQEPRCLYDNRPFTASDHRKIADVLDPAAAPSDTPPVGLEAEMAKQASYGHKEFCVGVHPETDLYVWRPWTEAFAKLRAVSLPAPTPDK